MSVFDKIGHFLGDVAKTVVGDMAKKAAADGYSNAQNTMAGAIKRIDNGELPPVDRPFNTPAEDVAIQYWQNQHAAIHAANMEKYNIARLSHKIASGEA